MEFILAKNGVPTSITLSEIQILFSMMFYNALVCNTRKQHQLFGILARKECYQIEIPKRYGKFLVKGCFGDFRSENKTLADFSKQLLVGK